MTFPEARAALAALTITRNRQLSTDMRERLIRLDALAILDALEAAQTQAAAYRERYPADTPGRTFVTIADRLRAGESEDAVLADYGLVKVAPSYCPRCGKPVTACCEEEKDCE